VSTELSSAEFEAWGGRMRVVATAPQAVPAALAAVRRTVDEFDAACSSFRADSELARLNAAEGRPLACGPVLLDALEAALRAARATDGDVDPTVGQALVAYGFTPAVGVGGRRIVRVPGYETIELDRARAIVRLGRGVRVDLGATAKALAADRAAAAAYAAAEQAGFGCGVLVSLAGDIALAGPPPEAGWAVRVTDDHRSGLAAPGQTIAISEGGLATSSTTVRSGPAGHHVIDPATGRPASVHFRTVSVAAATCLDANVATTAAIVRGARAELWLEGLGLPSRLVTVQGAVRHLAGWPADGEDLPAAVGGASAAATAPMEAA
jgi:thiamine biosynthesis lipoprotein